MPKLKDIIIATAATLATTGAIAQQSTDENGVVELKDITLKQDSAGAIIVTTPQGTYTEQNHSNNPYANIMSFIDTEEEKDALQDQKNKDARISKRIEKISKKIVKTHETLVDNYKSGKEEYPTAQYNQLVKNLKDMRKATAKQEKSQQQFIESILQNGVNQK